MKFLHLSIVQVFRDWPFRLPWGWFGLLKYAYLQKSYGWSMFCSILGLILFKCPQLEMVLWTILLVRWILFVCDWLEDRVTMNDNLISDVTRNCPPNTFRQGLVFTHFRFIDFLIFLWAPFMCALSYFFFIFRYRVQWLSRKLGIQLNWEWIGGLVWSENRKYATYTSARKLIQCRYTLINKRYPCSIAP